MSVDWIRKNVEGALLPQEGEYLFALARACEGNGVIVEIGSLIGFSTCFLALGSMYGPGVKVYAIDPFNGGDSEPESDLVQAICGEGDYFPVFQRNIRGAGVSDFVVPIAKRSVDAVDDVNEAIELLFIDGAHDYEHVLEDFLLYSSKVVDGGIIVFHDRTTPGVERVIREHVATSPVYETKVFKTLLCATKKDVNKA